MIVPFLVLQAATLTLDPQVTQGTWEGWGTSLCWMGKAFGARDDLADLFFTTKTVTIVGERLPGLGMNIVRYNAGACSWNEVNGRKMVVGRGIQPFRQIEGFWLDPTKGAAGWDWSMDKAQRAMMQKAKARGADRFELFSNSPMWWMCENDNPSGAADAKLDNLRKDQHDAFAVYLAEVAKIAKTKWGVTFTTVEPFNEPASSYWGENGKQEGCHFSAMTQMDILPRLRRELDARGLRTMPLAASDETAITQAVQTWSVFGAETKALVAQVNVHGYEGEKAPRPALREAVGSKPLWLSEHGENDGSGLSLARNLGLDFRDLRPLAWCYWQPLDGGGWGFLDADVPNTKILRASPKYFVMAQYARHIRPGMTILDTGDENVVAAFDRKRRKLVVVALNSRSAEAQRSFDLSRFNRVGGTASVWTTEPKGTARYEKGLDLRLVAKRLDLSLPAGSIRTVEIANVEP